GRCAIVVWALYGRRRGRCQASGLSLGTFRGIAAVLIRLFSRFLHAGHWGEHIAREQDILHRLKATTLLSCSERPDGRVLRPPEERSGLRAPRRFALAAPAVNFP